jgi:GNAT superfamily N-acetyltransferase
MTDQNHVIREVREEDWSRLKPLWQSFYEHQKEHGMLLDLPPDAYEQWASSLQPVLGRFGFLFVAEESHTLFGFLAGRIRSQPDYFGGQPTGFLSDLFITDSHRRGGVARELLSAAARWFDERSITRVELQIVINNDHAREFFRRQGWREELVQLVWQADKQV